MAPPSLHPFTIAGLATPTLLVTACLAPPCALPEGLPLPLAQEQIAMPGLDSALRHCVVASYGDPPFEATGLEDWDRFLAGDNSALSNEAKLGALLYLGGHAPAGEGSGSSEGRVLLPGLDFEEMYRRYVTRRDSGSRRPPEIEIAPT